MIRTLHLTNAWHPASGGIGTFYRAMLDAANREAWHARLVVPSAQTRYEPIGEFAGIYHIAAPQAPFNPQYRVLYPSRYLLRGSPIRKILLLEQPDIIETADKYTLPYLSGLIRRGLVPELRRRPVLIGLSCERMDDNARAYRQRAKMPGWFPGAYMKWIYFPQFDHHIAVSAYAAEELRSAARGHLVRRGVWIRGMGVDLSVFSPRWRNPEARQQLLHRAGFPENSFVLLYAGRLVPEKNLGLLVETAALLGGENATCGLILAGSGSEEGHLLSKLRAARVPHAHLRHVGNREELAALYANCDAFLHPNPREPFGIAPLEAMASGLPLVAPCEGGVTAYAAPDNSWLAPPTAAGFAEAVRQIRADPPQREARVRHAVETAAKWGWPAACARFLRLYEDLATHNLREPAAFYSTAGNRWGVEASP